MKHCRKCVLLLRGPIDFAVLSRLFCCLLLCGWFSGAALASSSPSLDEALQAIIQQHELRGDPGQDRSLPDINAPLAQLGKKLFFSKALSGREDTACASCHHPFLGGGDGLSLPIGVGASNPDQLGPGRRHSIKAERYDGSPPVPRNAPTTFNIALWDHVMFHDGRVERLRERAGPDGARGAIRTPDSFYGTADPLAGDDLVAAQARFPVTSEVEMRSFLFERGHTNDEVRAQLVQRLIQSSEEATASPWLAAFREGYQRPQGTAVELITFDHISTALSAYQRSQHFVNSPWRAYLQGELQAISTLAKKGALLFYNSIQEGGANCVACHTGDFFTDEQFHTLAIPQIGRGKRIGSGGNADFGRFAVSKRPEDRYAFRTPTLLNVEVTGPYGHDGAYRSLEGVVRHHLNPEKAVEDYDIHQLESSIDISNWQLHTNKALKKLRYQQRHDDGVVLRDVMLSEQDINELLTFLNTLTDPCVKSPTCLAPWVPVEGEDDPALLLLKSFKFETRPLLDAYSPGKDLEEERSVD